MKHPQLLSSYRTLILVSVGILFYSIFFGERALAAPETFTEIQPAIAAAKKGNQLLLFVLLKSLSKESDAVDKILKEDIILSEKEFVIVRCKVSQSAHRKIFKDKFKLDPEKAPMAAVANSEGGLLVSASGTSASTYRTLTAVARVKNGFETNLENVRKTMGKMAEDGKIVDGPVGEEIATLGRAPVFLIRKRTWTFKNGKTLKAGLLEAQGPTGVFVGEDGKKIVRNFNDLSPEDIAFLTKELKP